LTEAEMALIDKAPAPGGATELMPVNNPSSYVAVASKTSPIHQRGKASQRAMTSPYRVNTGPAMATIPRKA